MFVRVSVLGLRCSVLWHAFVVRRLRSHSGGVALFALLLHPEAAAVCAMQTLYCLHPFIRNAAYVSGRLFCVPIFAICSLLHSVCC